MINDGVAGRADGFYWPAPNDLADLVATILPDTSLRKATIFLFPFACFIRRRNHHDMHTVFFI